MPCVENWRGTIATMTRFGHAAVFLLIAGGALAGEPPCPAAVPTHLELPATRPAIAHDQPIMIVALGSSSTEGAGASAPDRTYPARLDTLLHASWPGARVTTLNRGIGGQTIDAVLPRLDADVITAHPTLVIWQVGTNEAMRGMDPVKFDALLDEGLRRLATIGGDVVLMDYQMAPRMPPAAQRDVYGAIIAKEAQAHAVPLFSRAALMRAWQAADPTAIDMIGPDGLHHSDRGYACLAAALDAAVVSGAAPRLTVVNVKSK